jgi:ABC-type polysaccharide/polyol phosphate transport system ATPase subunit
MSGAALIEARGITKTFRLPSVRRETLREHLIGAFRSVPADRLEVLRGVDLEVGSGESLAIMGRNGSGKSTLLKIICGIYRPDDGSVIVRAPIMPILQLGIGWNPELDAVDNVLVLGTVMGMSLREARASIDEILAFAGLEKFANLQVKHFSSGMASRLTYAVAFQAVREVLILDEIFAVGDAGFRARCEERYVSLIQEGYTVVMVSHDTNTVASFCSRAVLLEDGRVTMSGAGRDVAAEYVSVTSQMTADGAFG